MSQTLEASIFPGGMMQAPDGTQAALPRSPRTRSGLPFGAVLGALMGFGLLVCGVGLLRDIDLYWHVLAGGEVLAGAGPDSLGRDWSYAPDPLPWVSTQWLAELLFFVVHSLGGWAALAAFRVVTLGIALALLAHSTLRGRPAALAGFPFLLAGTALVLAAQERPQQFTLIGSAALGGVLVAGLFEARLPRWWIVALGTTLWANLHGGWILVPVTFGLIAGGRLLDLGPRDAAARRAVVLAGLSALAGCLTPSGLSGLTAAVRFSSAADLVAEWQPTQPMTALGATSVLLLIVAALAWARTQGRVPLSEVLVLLALLVFSWTAWRNLAPAMAMAAPLVARRLTLAFPGVPSREPRWSAPLGIGLAVVLGALSVATVIGRDHLPRDTRPIALAEQISTLPAGQRVLNDYNAAGVILFFAPEGTRVAIDGRTDRYGAQYIEDYVGMMSLRGEWEGLLDRLAPTSALLEDDCALAHVLVAERGWSQVGSDAQHVLLVAP